MSNTMTQTDMVIAELRRRGDDGLTPLDALDLIGSFRLASRIFEAKDRIRDDEEIVTQSATLPTGKTVARYVLRKRVIPGASQSTLWD